MSSSFKVTFAGDMLKNKVTRGATLAVGTFVLCIILVLSFNGAISISGWNQILLAIATASFGYMAFDTFTSAKDQLTNNPVGDISVTSS